MHVGRRSALSEKSREGTGGGGGGVSQQGRYAAFSISTSAFVLMYFSACTRNFQVPGHRKGLGLLSPLRPAQ